MSETVLITGGTGTLGRHHVRVLEEREYVPRVMSRSERLRGWPEHREWARADLSFGEGLGAALQGVDFVLHAATSPTRYREVDVAGTDEHLLPAARSAGIRHLVFPSIVGADEIPFGYYDAKVEIEEALDASDVPTTVARATRFHSFVLPLIRGAGKLPVMPLPAELRLQTVYAGEFADFMVDLMEEEPVRRAPDFAGPEVRTLGDMAEAWAELRRKSRWIVRLPLPGSVFRAFRAGKATSPDRAAGTVRWEEWLAGEATRSPRPRPDRSAGTSPTPSRARAPLGPAGEWGIPPWRTSAGAAMHGWRELDRLQPPTAGPTPAAPARDRCLPPTHTTLRRAPIRAPPRPNPARRG